MSEKEIQKVGDFDIVKSLSQGDFGKFCLGKNIKTGEWVFVKFESKVITPSQIDLEASILRKLDKIKGIPKMHFYGEEDKKEDKTETKYKVLIMQLLGPNLENKLIDCGNRFSLKTTIQIALQLLDVFRWVHNKGIIIRNVKPDNFVLGRGKEANQIYLIDFRLAESFITNGKHVPLKSGLKPVGCFRFMSINSQLGLRMSRRDDLESFAYVLLFFVNGKLPWQGFDTNDVTEINDVINKVVQIKTNTSLNQLCKGLPEEFNKFVGQVRKLKFEEEPKYDDMKKLFKKMFENHKFKEDGIYDWNLIKY